MLDPTRCAKEVTGEGGWHHHQCPRKIALTEEGKGWCRQHAPSSVAATRKAGQARWEAKWAAQREARERPQRRLAAAGKLAEALSVMLLDYERLIQGGSPDLEDGRSNLITDARSALAEWSRSATADAVAPGSG